MDACVDMRRAGCDGNDRKRSSKEAMFILLLWAKMLAVLYVYAQAKKAEKQAQKT